MDPREAFYQWFDSLPLQLQQDTALFAGAFLGLLSGNTSPEGELRMDALVDNLRGYVAVEPVAHQVGKLICLKAIIDFALIRERSTPEDWDITREKMARAVEWLQQEAGPRAEERAREYLNYLPFRSRQWIKHAAAWRDLCESHLSEDNLHDWYMLDLLLRFDRLVQSRSTEK
jgi:hypothetical protein